MPSGWAASGIDWTSPETLRNSRTEDVVHHLYKALYERFFAYYYIATPRSSMSVNDVIGPRPTASPPTLNTRLRSQYILRAMREILQKLYAEDESYVFEGKYWGTRCMIANDYTPSHSVGFWNIGSGVHAGGDRSDPRWGGFQTAQLAEELAGVEVLDCSLGGNLETAVNYDLTFIRNLDYETRLDHNLLHAIYRIITFPQSCAANLTQKITNTYGTSYWLGLRSYGQNNYAIDDGYTNHANESYGQGGDVNTAINDMYSRPTGEPLRFGGSWGRLQYTYHPSTNPRSRAYNQQYGFAIGQMFKDQSFFGWPRNFDIEDIKVYNRTFSYQCGPDPKHDDPYGYDCYDEFPMGAFGNNGNWQTNIQIFDQILPPSSYRGEIEYMHCATGKVTSGIPTLPLTPGVRTAEEIAETTIPAIDITEAPGFLEYYTET